MAIVQQKVSDLSGQPGDEAHFAKMVIRQHPKVQEAKALDLLVPEIEPLKGGVADMVICEITLGNGETKELFFRYGDFVKVIPDEVVVKARGTRGRVPGTRLS